MSTIDDIFKSWLTSNNEARIPLPTMQEVINARQSDSKTLMIYTHNGKQFKSNHFLQVDRTKNSYNKLLIDITFDSSVNLQDISTMSNLFGFADKWFDGITYKTFYLIDCVYMLAKDKSVGLALMFVQGCHFEEIPDELWN